MRRRRISNSPRALASSGVRSLSGVSTAIGFPFHGGSCCNRPLSCRFPCPCLTTCPCDLPCAFFCFWPYSCNSWWCKRFHLCWLSCRGGSSLRPCAGRGGGAAAALQRGEVRQGGQGRQHWHGGEPPELHDQKAGGWVVVCYRCEGTRASERNGGILVRRDMNGCLSG